MKRFISNLPLLLALGFFAALYYWGIYANPLMSSDSRERRELARNAIENHTLEEQAQILAYCKAMMFKTREENDGDRYASGSFVHGRIYKEGSYQVLQTIAELPFLSFDSARFDGIGCEIFIHKEFDFAIGYVVRSDKEDNVSLHKFEALQSDEVKFDAS